MGIIENYVSDMTGGLPRFGSISLPPDGSVPRIRPIDVEIATKIPGIEKKLLPSVDGKYEQLRNGLAIAASFVISVGFIQVLSSQAVYLSLPNLTRYLITTFFTFLPLGVVFLGLFQYETLSSTLVQIERAVWKGKRERVLAHEAGHFLCGYLLGFPPKNLLISPLTSEVEFWSLDSSLSKRMRASLGFDPSLDDDDFVSWVNGAGDGGGDGGGEGGQSKPFYPREAEDPTKLPAEEDPRYQWPFRGFGRPQIEELAILSMAGVASELLFYPQSGAYGGYADFLQLNSFMANAQTELEGREKENIRLWGVMKAVTQLKLHRGVLHDLKAEFEKGSSLARCIAVIEESENDVEAAEGAIGEREKEGGDAGIRLPIYGDDPLYIAGGLAVTFAVFASAFWR